MLELEQSVLRNQLLHNLDELVFAAIAPHLLPVKLKTRQQLTVAYQPVECAYFFENGVASVVAVTPTGLRTEVAMVGREGCMGIDVVLGSADASFDVFMQSNGTAHALPVAVLARLCDAHPSLRHVLLDFVHVLLIEVSHTAIASASLSLRQRLARWLLMSHDRVDGDEMPMTHEFLSLLLSARRPGITEAIQALESEGAIEATRGLIAITDRKALLALAGSAYGGPEAEYRRRIVS